MMRPVKGVPRWTFALPVALCLLAYAAGLTGGFVFDSEVSLPRNERLQIDGRSLDEWRVAALTFHGSPLGRPVAMASFALNHVVAGDLVVWQIRLVNLLLHLSCAALVFAFARLLGRYLWGAQQQRRVAAFALLAATLWLLHPLHVSTVLYSIQRMTQLSALFTLLGLVWFAAWRMRWSTVSPPRGEVVAAALITLALTALAALSKENGILLPWLLAVTEVAFFRGLWGGRRSGALQALAWSAVLVPVVCLIVVAQPALFEHFGDYSHRDFTLGERLLTQARVLWHYVAWLVLPDIQSMGLHHDDIVLSRDILRPWTTLGAIVAWSAVLVTALVLRRRFPVLLFAALFYLAGHALESTILPLEIAWEHRNYLPSVGVVMLISAALLGLCHRFAPGREALVIAAVALVLAPLLWLRADRWSDDLTLGFHNAVNHPSSVRANYEYASALFQSWQAQRDAPGAQEKLIAARHYYERMYQLAPRRIDTLLSLYVLDEYYFDALGRRAGWFAQLEENIQGRRLSASDVNALSMLRQCLAEGYCRLEPDRVNAFYSQLTRNNPAQKHVWLAWSDYQRRVVGQPAQVRWVLRRALEANPEEPDLWLELANLHARQGDKGRALRAIAGGLRSDARRIYLHSFRAGFSRQP